MLIQRKELYDLVWSKPVTDIASQFKTTGIEVRKICVANNIPLPENGYWIKLKFEKEVKIIPLPESNNPTREIEIAEKALRSRKDVKNGETHPEQVREEYHVPTRLTNPDTLIQAALNELKEREKYHSRDSLITLFDSIKIKATKNLFDRALRFMDALIKIFRKNGYTLEIKNRETYVIIGSEKIPISCRETIKRIQVPTKYGQQSQDTPTGLLCFQMGGFRPKQWIDGKKRLEDQILSILEKLEAEAERLRLWHIEIEDYWKIKNEEERIEKEKEDLKQKDLQNFVALLNASDRFHRAKELREYVDTVSKNLNESDENYESTKSWIDWAKKKIDWYDPLINNPDTNLEEVDKETLSIKKTSYL